MAPHAICCIKWKLSWVTKNLLQPGHLVLNNLMNIASLHIFPTAFINSFLLSLTFSPLDLMWWWHQLKQECLCFMKGSLEEIFKILCQLNATYCKPSPTYPDLHLILQELSSPVYQYLWLTMGLMDADTVEGFLCPIFSKNWLVCYRHGVPVLEGEDGVNVIHTFTHQYFNNVPLNIHALITEPSWWSREPYWAAQKQVRRNRSRVE